MGSRAKYAIVPYVPPVQPGVLAGVTPVGMVDLPEDVMLKVMHYLIDFEPAAKFSGPRPGFVFKTGRRGLGYYVDAPERAVGANSMSLSATCSVIRAVMLASLEESASSDVRDMQERYQAASQQHDYIIRQKLSEPARGPRGGGRVTRYTIEISGACHRALRARIASDRSIKFFELCREAKRKASALVPF